jgi:hypothetical protein
MFSIARDYFIEEGSETLEGIRKRVQMQILCST